MTTMTAEPVTHDTDLPCPGRHPDHDAPALPIWCRPCQDDIINALNRIHGHVTDLARRPDGRTSTINNSRVQYEGQAAAGRHTGTSPKSPSPAWDAIDRTIHHILALEETVRDIADMPPAERLNPRHSRYRGLAGTTTTRINALDTATAFLNDYRTALLALEDAYTIGVGILTLERTLQRLTGTDRLIHRLPVPCPRCERLSLIREDGDDRVRCTNPIPVPCPSCTNRHKCGLIWREDQYAWFTRLAADAAHATT